MNIDGLQCNLLDVFQNDDHSVLQKWKSLLQEFRSRVAAKIETRIFHEKECAKKKSENAKKISELQHEIDTIESNIDATILQQKIIDKKISNITKSQESLKNELEEMKAQRDSFSLEMVDLQLGLEERKRRKILQWDAIKRACNIYKVNLNMHISLEEKADCQHAKISFFIHNEATKDKYFLELIHNNDHWKIERIEPKLRKEHFKELNIDVDSSECSRIPDITLFLCQVRSIFLKHYIKKGKNCNIID